MQAVMWGGGGGGGGAFTCVYTIIHVGRKLSAELLPSECCANSVSNVLLHRAGTDKAFFTPMWREATSFGDSYCSDGERKEKYRGEIAVFFGLKEWLPA